MYSTIYNVFRLYRTVNHNEWEKDSLNAKQLPQKNPKIFDAEKYSTRSLTRIKKYYIQLKILNSNNLTMKI